MATDAYLVCSIPNGRLSVARLHSDGYPEFTLPMLEAHYVEPESVESLIGLGEIRCFELDGDARSYVDAIRPRSFDSLDQVLASARRSYVEHVYVFADGVWSHVEV